VNKTDSVWHGRHAAQWKCTMMFVLSVTKLHSRFPAHKLIVFRSSMRQLCMLQKHGSKRSHLPGRGTDLYIPKLNPNYRILRIHLNCHCELRFNKILTARCERSGRKSCRAQWRHC